MDQGLDQLLERSRRGDADSFSHVIRRFHRWAMGRARRVVKDEHLAEDAVQNAFMKAFRRLNELRDLAAFPGWLGQIVWSEAQGVLRRRRECLLENAPMKVAREPGPAARTELEELRGRVREALGTLPPHGRQAAELFYLREHSCDEIARMLCIPCGTVRRLHEARQRLHGKLSRYVDKEERM